MKYLGEEIINQENTPFKDYNTIDWIMYFLEQYGQFDGSHHKQWTLDQISRIKHQTPIIIKLAKWDNGLQSYHISTGKPSEEYLNWVKLMKGNYDKENDEYEYDYDEGIAP